ncbi:MAG: chromosome partitioning protein [Treponema sp.]|jgi:phage shock protein A|nr:chromosome partitioning protein [Treponema sp.]
MENIHGMDESSAKQYLLGFITTYKLTIKKIDEIDSEIAKWNSRIELARSKGAADLTAEAEKETQRLNDEKQKLLLEADELKTQITEIQNQFKTLGAYERSVDPNLLEQELLIAAGYNPGDEEKLHTDNRFKTLEKESRAQAALDELKAKMGKKD